MRLGRRLGPRWRRIIMLLLCLVLTGWLLLDAKHDRYSGLPVNTLGQVLGDLLLMGLAAPVVDRRKRLRRRSPMNDLFLLDRLAKAKHRIQLLDVRLYATVAGPPLAGPPSELARALAQALDNDALVEILMPDPETPVADAARRAVESLLVELRLLAETAVLGRLDVRLYSVPTTISMVRCDQDVWARLHPEGSPRVGSALAIDARSDNARVLYEYFNQIQADARPAARAHGAAELRQPARTASKGVEVPWKSAF